MIGNKLYKCFWKLIGYLSPEKYARHLGVKIGKNCFIRTLNWSSEPYLITIGDNCQITSDVRFHTHGGGHVLRDEIPNFDMFGKIVIGDWVYIGAGTQIMPGVTIGSHSLVAAGSIVTKSVPAYCVVGGNPARVICSVDDFKKKNLKYNLNCKSYDAVEKKKMLLSTSEGKFIKK